MFAETEPSEWRLVVSRDAIAFFFPLLFLGFSRATDGGGQLWQKVNVEGRAKATYRAKEDCEISFQKGDSLLVEESETDWLRVLRRDTGTRGLCPVSYVDYDVPADRASSKDLLGMLGNVTVCACRF